MVTRPESIQTNNNQPELPTVLAISELVIKIPEPIMEPVTSKMPSSKLKDLLKWPSCSLFSIGFVFIDLSFT
jgi:hypothetical protein